MCISGHIINVTYCRTHAYGFTALGNRNTDLNNYRKKIEKHELGQKELNPALVTDLLWFELL